MDGMGLGVGSSVIDGGVDVGNGVIGGRAVVSATVDGSEGTGVGARVIGGRVAVDAGVVGVGAGSVCIPDGRSVGGGVIALRLVDTEERAGDDAETLGDDAGCIGRALASMAVGGATTPGSNCEQLAAPSASAAANATE